MTDIVFSIRRLTAAGVDATASLLAEVISSLDYYSPEAQRSEIQKYTADDLCESLTDDPDSVLVAVSSDDKIIGYCISTADDGLIWLAWFGVHPHRRRSGVGRALLDALQRTVRARGAHKTWCDCRTTNTVSAALLASAGFIKICTVRNHWYGHDFFLLERPVDE